MAEKKGEKRKCIVSFPTSCEYGCGKYFDKTGNSELNYKRHLEKCYNNPNKARYHNVINYFMEAGSERRTVTSLSPTSSTNTSHEAAEIIIGDENVYVIKLNDASTDVIITDETIDVPEVCEISSENIVSKEVKLCKGFTILLENQESFFRIYPFHWHASEDPNLQLKYCVNIHSDTVTKQHSLVAHTSVCSGVLEDTSVEVNKCCSDIEHSQLFKKCLR